MIEYLNSEPLVALIAIACAVIGFTGGLGLALTLIFWQEGKKQTAETHPPRKLSSPRQYKKESDRRATLQAVCMVETGAITTPTRR